MKGIVMGISNIAAYSAQQGQELQKTDVRPDAGSAASKDAAVESADRVELSKGYTEVARMKNNMTETDDVRTEQVEKLRQMIQNGSYVVQPEKIAEKMLESDW